MGDYVGKQIKVELVNNHYYRGKVIFEDELFIIIIDMVNKKVQFSKNSILSLEVLN